MKIAYLLVSACLVACSAPRLVPPLRYAATAGTPDEPFRATPPRLPAVSERLDAPPRDWTLANGIRAIFIERHDYPLLAARLLIDRGSLDLDDAGSIQVDQATYLYGRGGRQEAFDALGADAARAGIRRWTGAQLSDVWAGVTAPADALDTALDDLKRMTFDAELGPVEYDVRAAEWVQVARAGSVSIETAERSVLFGDRHPYGFAGHGREMIPIEAAQAIHARLFQPAHAILVVVGDVGLERLQQSVERAFGPVAGSVALAKQEGAPPARPGPRVALVRNRGLTQVRGAVFARGPAPSSEDMLAPAVVAELLAGGPSSTLLEQLREEAGAAYSLGARTSAARTASWISLAASYDADKAVAGVAAVLAAIRALRAGHVTDDQVAVARETIVAQWREEQASVDGAAAMYASAIALGLGMDWARDLPARVASVRREDLVRVANQYLTDPAMHVVFEGDDRWLDVDPLGMGGPTELDRVSR